MRCAPLRLVRDNQGVSVSANETLLRSTFQALSEGDLAAVARVFTEDAQWYGVQEGTHCEGREAILAMMGRNRGSGLRGTIEELTEHGSRVLVGFRPAHSRADGRPLDGGIGYSVVTMREGLVCELKGCADRASAIAYVDAHMTA